MEWDDGVLIGGTAEERTEEFENHFVSVVNQMLVHGISSGRMISLMEAAVREHEGR